MGRKSSNHPWSSVWFVNAPAFCLLTNKLTAPVVVLVVRKISRPVAKVGKKRQPHSITFKRTGQPVFCRLHLMEVQLLNDHGLITGDGQR